ncbi:Crp/Fnr family transcriptional regulator [Acidicapsa ligni]|uniref:Crp/Fnr family transcriptional regulator n=1 Tax=Acidicapsa ligni TaxID=542300 RepID=UPI0021DFEB95|nr:Crp/Fnr family transcriptional regulator [Acidicapsa ligni]
MPTHVLTEYDSMGVHMMLPSGGILFSEGRTPQWVSVLCSGQVKLSKSSKDGKTFLVRIAKPGDVLGLSAVLSGTPYEVTAQAIEPVQMKCFHRDEFLHFLQHHVEGNQHAAESLNNEYRAALLDACRLALSSSIVGRMAHLLLQFASEAGTLEQDQPEILLSLTHEDLASMLGTTRESVTRILNELKRKHILSITGIKTRILRKNALEALA